MNQGSVIVIRLSQALWFGLELTESVLPTTRAGDVSPGKPKKGTGYPNHMKRRTKKEIKEAIEKLKDKPAGSPSFKPYVGKVSDKKTSQRIRKQGV